MKLTIAMLLLLTSSAYAGEVDFSRHITDLDGKDIPVSAAKDAKPTDLALIAGTALLVDPQPGPGTPSMRPEDKLARFNLALKVHKSGQVNLTSEEVTLLKSAIATAFGSLVYGRAVEILDPPAKPKDK